MLVRLLPVVLTTVLLAASARAQSPVVPRLGPEPLGEVNPTRSASAAVPPRSGAAAFGLSLLVPGLGHRYATGTWGAASTAHALADAALWVGLVEAGIRLDRAEDSYETLAALRADAEVEGRGRGFFLNLSRYRSSEAYVETLLRTRQWTELEEAQRPENQWAWASTGDFERYRALREDAESLRRRRPVYAALLAGNRLLAGVGALRTTHRVNRAEATLSLGPPPPGTDAPTVHLSVRF